MKIYPDYAEYLSRTKSENSPKIYLEKINYLNRTEAKKKLKSFLKKENIIKSYNKIMSSEDMSRIIGKNILHLRISARLTQKQVAAIIDCDKFSVFCFSR